MNRVVVFSLALILGSIPVSAQDHRQFANTQEGKQFQLPVPSELSSSQNSNFYLESHANSCPIGIRARHGLGGQARWVRNVPPPKGVSQLLHVTLSKANDVVGVGVTVHGYGSKMRFSPMELENGSDSAQITRSLQFDVRAGAEGNASNDLVLNAFTAVIRIDLDFVRYANGATWESSSSESCHVTPDDMMLISSR